MYKMHAINVKRATNGCMLRDKTRCESRAMSLPDRTRTRDSSLNDTNPACLRHSTRISGDDNGIRGACIKCSSVPDNSSRTSGILATCMVICTVAEEVGISVIPCTLLALWQAPMSSGPIDWKFNYGVAGLQDKL